jgi:surface antigen
MDSPTDPQYGHVAIVTKVNADGSFVVKDSNFVGKGIV